MLIIPPKIVRKKRARMKAPTAAPTPPPGAPLNLEDANYYHDTLTLVISFDRDISISGFVPSQITVSDGQYNNHVYTASGATMLGTSALTVTLVAGATYEADQVVMNASALTGITAVNDGGTWAGASDLGLPYGG